MKDMAAVDYYVIRLMRRCAAPAGRLALLVVYGWFGVLKVIGLSPASPLVTALQSQTLPFLGAESFLVLFGVFEVFIGICFIIPRAERIALVLMAGHMVMTALPLVVLPGITWSAPLVPTLEGQYIIKNVALIAVAIALASRLSPMRLAGK
jgi:uncharacterized membrane protein YkgB